jgi:uncharacterized protein YjbI with pentapeptide repeats
LSPLLLVCPSPARADIFQWEYINPADPSQRKRQSTTLAPDGAGVDAVPGADLSYRNLTMAYLIGADLTGTYGDGANLTNADLSHSNLTASRFIGARLTDADFTGAQVRDASFARNPFSSSGTGISLAQLYSTASYQAHDLTGVSLHGNFLTGGNFVGQNLANASFMGAWLSNADFTNAEIRGASFNALFSPIGSQFPQFGTGLALAQLYATASYERHDLSSIVLNFNDLAGGNFADQNVSNAFFTGATLTQANFRRANLTNAYFGGAALTGSDFTHGRCARRVLRLPRHSGRRNKDQHDSARRSHQRPDAGRRRAARGARLPWVPEVLVRAQNNTRHDRRRVGFDHLLRARNPGHARRHAGTLIRR